MAVFLIVEDSKPLREHIMRVLREAGLASRFWEAENGLQGFKALIKEKPDLVICDLFMPEMDGYKFLDMKASRPECKDIPVIMITAQEDMQKKVVTLERGAVDCITKPFDEGDLVARVKVHLQLKSLQDELRHANTMLQKLSITDSLTSVYNRRFLMEVLEKELLRSQRYNDPFSFIMLDLDGFKDVNDKYGHQMGDFVLRELAQIVFRQLRNTDILARYGGDEFAILLPGTDAAGATALAERIRTVVEEHVFRRADAFARLTLSVGVLNYPEAKVKTVDDIVRMTDEALYEAKNKGRNLVAVAGKN
jgi:diguanylate cyclase (GGDEF)-like protein